MKIMKRSCLFFLSIVFFATCNKSEPVLEDGRVDGESHSVIEYIKRLGYHESEIRDIDDNYYLVDGDILFVKDAKPSFSIFGDGPKTKQSGTSNYVGYNIQPNVTVRIDPSLSAYTAEITAALAIWNSVINTRLKFSLTTSTNQHILISHLNLGTGGCGAAAFPMNGLPGTRVYLNANEMAGMSVAQRQGLAAHELGHAIGFRHTNWQADGENQTGTDPGTGAKFHAVNILGTPGGSNPDPNSIMNSGSGIASCSDMVNTTLSSYDIVAFQFLYPSSGSVLGASPVFRYFNVNTDDHFFTTNINELGNGSNNGWIFEGVGFFAPSMIAYPNIIPIYRYYSASKGDHFYTRTPGSYNKFVSEGIAFYAFYPGSSGAMPVYRYFNGNKSDHHYTKNPSEGSMGGYSYEGIEFYAF